MYLAIIPGPNEPHLIITCALSLTTYWLLGNVVYSTHGLPVTQLAGIHIVPWHLMCVIFQWLTKFRGWLAMEVISIAQSATATTSQLWEEPMFILQPGILEILKPYEVMQKHGGML